MLIDEVEISLKAGHGGNGVATLRREKFVPKGGPDGGDGGNGGSIYFKVNPNTDTLSYFNSRKQFSAPNGQNGRNKKMYGRGGEDLILNIPPGTLIYEIKDNKKIKVIDMLEKDSIIKICAGGKGGLGNVHFKSSTNQTPKEFTNGEKGERKRIILELQLIADVGLVGLPNSGKSTFLSKISSANPKIADYPFTTIIPNLGLVRHQNKNFIVADIPGIIDKASTGKGLGFQFLKHINRTRINVLVLDATSNIAQDYKILSNELKKYDEKLFDKIKIIMINKIDLIETRKFNQFKNKIKRKFLKNEIVFVSALNDINIDKTLDLIVKFIRNA